MSAVNDTAAIDEVLSSAVDTGAVPHVVAIAADRDGVIYSGASGPRAVGEGELAGPEPGPDPRQSLAATNSARSTSRFE